MRSAFDEGIAWGEAKQALFDKVEAAVSAARVNPKSQNEDTLF